MAPCRPAVASATLASSASNSPAAAATARANFGASPRHHHTVRQTKLCRAPRVDRLLRLVGQQQQDRFAIDRCDRQRRHARRRNDERAVRCRLYPVLIARMPVRPGGHSLRRRDVLARPRRQDLFEAVGQCRLLEMRVEVHGSRALCRFAVVHRIDHRNRRGQPVAAVAVVLRLAIAKSCSMRARLRSICHATMPPNSFAIAPGIRPLKWFRARGAGWRRTRARPCAARTAASPSAAARGGTSRSPPGRLHESVRAAATRRAACVRGGTCSAPRCGRFRGCSMFCCVSNCTA